MDGESSLLTLHSSPLLVSLQHAIDFLARQSSATDAIPQNMAKLARTHEAVTLLFMDICGYTTMSKVRHFAFLNPSNSISKKSNLCTSGNLQGLAYSAIRHIFQRYITSYSIMI
eukprot:900857-Pelagomonas_calceolata.AAC.1